MKKLMYLLVTGATLFSLVGCGGDGHGMPNGGSEVDLNTESGQQKFALNAKQMVERTINSKDAINFEIDVSNTKVSYYNKEKIEGTEIGLVSNSTTDLNIDLSSLPIRGGFQTVETAHDIKLETGNFTLNTSLSLEQESYLFESPATTINFSQSCNDGSFAVYQTNNNIYLDFSNKNFADFLTEIISTVLVSSISIPGLKIDSSLFFGKTGKCYIPGNFESLLGSVINLLGAPEIGIESPVSFIETIGESTETLLDLKNVKFKEYDDGSFAFEISINQNFDDINVRMLTSEDYLDVKDATSSGKEEIKIVVVSDDQLRLQNAYVKVFYDQNVSYATSEIDSYTSETMNMELDSKQHIETEVNFKFNYGGELTMPTDLNEYVICPVIALF